MRAFAQTHAGTHQTQSFFKRENKEREKKTHAGTHQTPLEWRPVAYENNFKRENKEILKEKTKREKKKHTPAHIKHRLNGGQ